MTLAEQFKCEIPTPDALKEGVLYCSTRPSNGWEITGFVLDLAVALGTLAAVVAAVILARRATQEAQKLEESRRADAFDREWKSIAARIGESLGSIAVSFPEVSKKEMFDFWSLRDQYAAFAGLEDVRLTGPMKELDAALNEAVRYWGAGDTGTGEAYGRGVSVLNRVHPLAATLRAQVVLWRSALLHWHYTVDDKEILEFGLKKTATELRSAVAVSVAGLNLTSMPNNHD